MRGATSAISKVNEPFAAPSTGRALCTVTFSPAMNGAVGRKLAPSPSESASTRPTCTPLSEPMTLTGPMAPPGTPRKEIWVSGRLYRLPGLGKTVTAAARALLTDVHVAMTASTPTVNTRLTHCAAPEDPRTRFAPFAFGAPTLTE